MQDGSLCAQVRRAACREVGGRNSAAETAQRCALKGLEVLVRQDAQSCWSVGRREEVIYINIQKVVMNVNAVAKRKERRCLGLV